MRLAVDTSVAVPLLVRTHRAHDEVVRWWGGRTLALSGHAMLETYAVLTRLPGDLQVAPQDAARLLAARFAAPLVLDSGTAGRLPQELASLRIAGGAVHDALVALAAQQNGARLATRDGRARNTYEAVGVEVEIASA